VHMTAAGIAPPACGRGLETRVLPLNDTPEIFLREQMIQDRVCFIKPFLFSQNAV
jgi:hypothetical protein